MAARLSFLVLTGAAALAASLEGFFGAAVAFETPAEIAALAGRAAGLALALAAVATRSTRPWAFAALPVAFAGSFLARGLGVPFVGLAALAAYPALSCLKPRLLAAPALFLAGGVALAANAHRFQNAADPPLPPAELVARELARGNLHRAHAAALAWSAREQPPGEGYLRLAEIDIRLGATTKARKVLEKVVTRSQDAAIVARARAFGATLE
ncbi:MAG: hypothetical protein JWP97_348 [Labilithrix sp.]|nr:hypothetical protein [Labilithrix sp.]